MNGNMTSTEGRAVSALLDLAKRISELTALIEASPRLDPKGEMLDAVGREIMARIRGTQSLALSYASTISQDAGLPPLDLVEALCPAREIPKVISHA